MPANPRKIPSYRLHKPTGQAVVRLDGRDRYLGKHDTPESREKYRRVVAEWLATGLASPVPVGPAPVPSPTVAEVILAFWHHAQEHYRAPDGTPSEELGNIKAALRPLRALYETTLARDFGPLALRAIRERMVADGLMRTTINGRINRIRRAFKWAASLELIPVSVVQSLTTVAGLQKGRTAAREPNPVEPVALEDVQASLAHLPSPVVGMIRIQLLTGMRPGEVCIMRGRDFEQDGMTWTYRPASHKSAWRGKTREIVIGPRAREIVEGFARPDPSEYLFDPRESVAEHHARRSAGRNSKPTPSETAKRAIKPGANHSRRYSRDSYRNAILRACEKAGVPPWTPNQLRHTAASQIRARFGLEAAQTVLGHSRADVTQVYAARDMARAKEVMREVG